MGLRELWVHGDGAGAARIMSDPDKTSKLDSLQKTMRRISGQFSKSEGPPARGAEKSAPEIDALQAQVKGLEEELYQVRQQLEQAQRQNERLVQTLTQAKEQIGALKEEVEKLTAPPASYGIFAGVNADGTVTVWTGGRKLKVNCHPGLDPATLQPGQELILNEALNIIEAKAFEVQ